MKLDYRIRRWSYPPQDKFFFTEAKSKDYFTAQYRIFGIWMNINHVGDGRFFQPKSVICETYDDAAYRVELHATNLMRAGDHFSRYCSGTWEMKV